jgi:hypothetical protein
MGFAVPVTTERPSGAYSHPASRNSVSGDACVTIVVKPRQQIGCRSSLQRDLFACNIRILVNLPRLCRWQVNTRQGVSVTRVRLSRIFLKCPDKKTKAGINHRDAVAKFRASRSHHSRSVCLSTPFHIKGQNFKANVSSDGQTECDSRHILRCAFVGASQYGSVCGLAAIEHRQS